MFDGKIFMANKAWQSFSLRLAVMFFVIAIANEFAYRTLPEASWVTFKVFYVPVFSLIYFMFQIRFLMKNNKSLRQ
jgi:intracellular septation protein